MSKLSKYQHKILNSWDVPSQSQIKGSQPPKAHVATKGTRSLEGLPNEMPSLKTSRGILMSLLLVQVDEANKPA